MVIMQLKLVFAALMILQSCRSKDNQLIQNIDTSLPPRQEIIDRHAAEDKAIDTLFKTQWVSLFNKAIYEQTAHKHGLTAITRKMPAGDTETFVFDVGENMPTHFVNYHTFYIQYPSLRISVLDGETMKLVPLEKYEFK
jgi:hypothetical protein